MSAIEKSASSRFGEQARFHSEDEGQSCDVYFGLEKVPDDWIDALWALYEESLHIEDAIQQQSCYARDAFIEALVDPDYGKTVLVVDGVPSGLLLATDDLEKASVTYINPDFIRGRFPEAVQERRFWYITSVFISPAVRNFGFVKLMGKASVLAVKERDYVIGCDMSDTRLFLLDMLIGIAAEEDFILEKELLGTQSYYALKKSREGDPE
jgi:hypothetical protein